MADRTAIYLTGDDVSDSDGALSRAQEQLINLLTDAFGTTNVRVTKLRRFLELEHETSDHRHGIPGIKRIPANLSDLLNTCRDEKGGALNFIVKRGAWILCRWTPQDAIRSAAAYIITHEKGES